MKGFILERYRYPTIIGTVFGYKVIPAHGEPVPIGESLLRSFVRFPVAFPSKRRFWFHKKEKKSGWKESEDTFLFKKG